MCRFFMQNILYGALLKVITLTISRRVHDCTSLTVNYMLYIYVYSNISVQRFLVCFLLVARLCTEVNQLFRAIIFELI